MGRTLVIHLVDADGLIYRAGFAADKACYTVKEPNGTSATFRYKKEADAYAETLNGPYEIECGLERGPVEHAIQNLRTVLDLIRSKCGVGSTIEYYLGGKGNFRKELATILPYKGNRSPFAKPTHYDALREYLHKQHGAVFVDGQEVDDEIGIRSTELAGKCVIVSTDKDLDMLPGLHYNWVKDVGYEIDDRTGMYLFYSQMLTGDRTDNIPGLPGVGDKKAAKLLEGAVKEGALWGCVYRAYFDHYGHRYDDDHTLDEALYEIGNLLWIRRERGKCWEFPR